MWIGAAPPADSVPSVFISQVRTAETPWLENGLMELNAGLVAVIGARGSGKTALVEMIASGANAMGAALGHSSFLKRASSPIDYLGSGRVELTWGDDSTTKAPLQPSRRAAIEIFDPEYACYLSQHFVDQLCSAEGLATELRREIERVVFDATDSTERLETDSFEQLANVLLEPVRRQREEIQGTIQFTSKSIVQEDLLRDYLPTLKKDRDAMLKQIEKDRKELQLLLPKGKQERAQRLISFEQACTNTEMKIENLRRRRQTLDDLAREIARIRTYTEPSRLADMRQRFAGAELSDADWKAFGMTFIGDVDAVLSRAKRTMDTAIAVVSEGDPSFPVDTMKAPPAEWPLKQLRATRDALMKDVGIDAQQQKKYDEIQRAIVKEEASLRHFEVDIANAEGADARRLHLINSRRTTYSQVFETFVEEERILTNLYAPLRQQIVGASGALAKLDFVVQRHADLRVWVAAGEQLLDLRKETRFRGQGTLQKEAEQRLLSAWTRGTADEVAAAMDEFRRKFHQDLLKAMPASIPAESRRAWTQSVATWLYDTAHIHIEYGIQYDGVVIEQLSPGTRGIVLLLLYLALDRQDRRPLIVDQPEENLDPNSVFEELVPHFREARKRRQVIVVTHNANLVVNTDADQVFVATSVRTAGGGLPNISYRCGSVREPRNPTFGLRNSGRWGASVPRTERRYRLRWGDNSALPTAGAKDFSHQT